MKRLGTILFAILFLLLSIPISVQAGEMPILSAESAEGTVGEVVSVNLVLPNNPGLIAMRIYAQYDSSTLRLLSVEDGGLFGDSAAFFGKDKSANPYTLYWADALSNVNHTKSGILATLTFLILDSAQIGTSEIRLSLDEESTFDVDLENVMVQMQTGHVQIKPAKPSNDDAIIYVEDVQAEPQEIIRMPVYLAGNPGIVAVKFSVSCNSKALLLVGAENGAVFSDVTVHFGNDLTEQPYTVYWEDALARENNYNNGVLVTLSFQVLQSAPIGDYSIQIDLDQSSTFNADLEEVVFETVSGTVSVDNIDSHVIRPGDADEDGEITLQDVALITRWLAGGWNVTINRINANVNQDGVVDLKDAVLIRRFLAGGWSVTLR